MQSMQGSVNCPLKDYALLKKNAVKWAKIALENRKQGLNWQQAAKNSHEYLKWALLIVR